MMKIFIPGIGINAVLAVAVALLGAPALILAEADGYDDLSECTAAELWYNLKLMIPINFFWIGPMYVAHSLWVFTTFSTRPRVSRRFLSILVSLAVAMPICMVLNLFLLGIENVEYFAAVSAGFFGLTAHLPVQVSEGENRQPVRN